MTFQVNPYNAPILLSALLGMAIFALAWGMRSARGARSFLVLMLLAVEYSLAYAVELSAPDLVGKLLWVKVEYVGIVFIPVLWLFFALETTNRAAWLKPAYRILMLIPPLITLRLLWLDNPPGLVLSQVELVTQGGFSAVKPTYGVWFWMHAIYSYSLLGLGTLAFIPRLSWQSMYRKQTVAILVGVLLPWLSNFAYLAGLTPWKYYDLTPLAFSFSALAFFWGVLRYKLFAISPVARQAIFNSMLDGVVALDLQGRVVDYNRIFLELGFDPELGQPLADAHPLLARTIEVLLKQTATRTELNLINGGSARVVDVRLVPLYETEIAQPGAAQGEPIGRIVTLRDITEQKRAEEEHRALKDFNELVVQNMADGIVVFDTEGKITFTNPTITRMLGYAPQELIGKPSSAFIHQDEAIVEGAGAPGPSKSGRFEFSFIHKDGRRVPIMVASAPLVNPVNGTLLGTLAVFSDISVRKQSEQVIRQSEESYRGLFNSLTEAVYIQDRQGFFLDVNPGAVHMDGYPREFLVGSTLESISAPDMNDLKAMLEHFAHAFDGDPQQFELWSRRSNGEIFPKEIHLTRGKYFGQDVVIATALDITERKRAEEALLRHAEAMSSLYATEQQRVAALSDALEQQKKLERLQREFIQNVSHELRTPIGILRGYAEMMETDMLDELSPGLHQPVKTIAENSRRLSTLVEDILAVVEMESHKITIEDVNMLRLVNDALIDFHAMAVKAGLKLTVDVVPDLPSVPGDTIVLYRMLENLIGNACKFTQPGGSVTVRLRSDPEYLVLEVADTGIGIAEKQLGQIFDRFYQGDGSLTRRYGGIGLGLALVKSIVEAHQGEISVQSQEGEGTTFTVRLPLQRKETHLED